MNDSDCEDAICRDINLVVPWILMASFGYYILDQSILSDPLFDKLCKTLLENYDHITHRHKHLITKEDLKAGTLYALREDDYPTIVIGALSKYIDTSTAMRRRLDKL